MTFIPEDMWPALRPGQVVVTKVSDDEALLSVGRRRKNHHVVRSETEAAVAWSELDKAFGFSEKVRKLRSA